MRHDVPFKNAGEQVKHFQPRGRESLTRQDYSGRFDNR